MSFSRTAVLPFLIDDRRNEKRNCMTRFFIFLWLVHFLHITNKLTRQLAVESKQGVFVKTLAILFVGRITDELAYAERSPVISSFEIDESQGLLTSNVNCGKSALNTNIGNNVTIIFLLIIIVSH